jgi:hypothetical protein
LTWSQQDRWQTILVSCKQRIWNRKWFT